MLILFCIELYSKKYDKTISLTFISILIIIIIIILYKYIDVLIKNRENLKY